MSVKLSLDYGGSTVVLPVNPEKIEVSRKVNHNKVEVVGMGEIIEAGMANLDTIKFESFIPHVFTKQYIPYLDAGVAKVAWYNEWFKAWSGSRRPARLILTGVETINTLVLCDQYDFYHQGGDTEDLYFTLSLTAYRDYSPKLVAVNTTQGNGAPSTNRGLTIGAEVIANGRLHADSWGNGAGLTERNARRVITHIVNDPTRGYPIHLALIGGTSDESTRFSHWRGWVTRESVTLV